MGGIQSKVLSKDEKDFYRKNRFKIFGTRQNNGQQASNSQLSVLKENEYFRNHQHHIKKYKVNYCSCD